MSRVRMSRVRMSRVKIAYDRAAFAWIMLRFQLNAVREFKSENRKADAP